MSGYIRVVHTVFVLYLISCYCQKLDILYEIVILRDSDAGSPRQMFPTTLDKHFPKSSRDARQTVGAGHVMLSCLLLHCQLHRTEVCREQHHNSQLLELFKKNYSVFLIVSLNWKESLMFIYERSLTCWMGQCQGGYRTYSVLSGLYTGTSCWVHRKLWCRNVRTKGVEWKLWCSLHCIFCNSTQVGYGTTCRNKLFGALTLWL